MCCKYSRKQLNWSEVTVSVLNGNKFGMIKNDEKQSKTMKNVEKTMKNDGKQRKMMKGKEKR